MGDNQYKPVQTSMNLFVRTLRNTNKKGKLVNAKNKYKNLNNLSSKVKFNTP